MGAVASLCCPCCCKTAKKYKSNDYGPARSGNNNTNYPYNGTDNSPVSYDNKIHVS
ncbi:unnamed protein product, partial [Rotaria magnacalcarata]